MFSVFSTILTIEGWGYFWHFGDEGALTITIDLFSFLGGVCPWEHNVGGTNPYIRHVSKCEFDCLVEARQSRLYPLADRVLIVLFRRHARVFSAQRR